MSIINDPLPTGIAKLAYVKAKPVCETFLQWLQNEPARREVTYNFTIGETE